MALGADLVVKLGIDSRQFTGDIRKTKSSLSGLASFAKSTLGRLAIGASVAQGLRSIVTSATDAQETLNKFNQVFGEQSDEANKFAENLAAIGRPLTEIRNGLAAFQGITVGLGFDHKEARQMSQQLQKLSIDFASFHNITDQEALQRFISGMSGSSEVLDRFGINIKASALNAEFLRLGIDATTASATEQQKAVARLNIIMKAMTDQGAVGDAKRTQGNFANQLKETWANLKTMAAGIGSFVLPPLNALLKFVNLLFDGFKVLAKGISDAWNRLKEFIFGVEDIPNVKKSILDNMSDGFDGVTASAERARQGTDQFWQEFNRLNTQKMILAGFDPHKVAAADLFRDVPGVTTENIKEYIGLLRKIDDLKQEMAEKEERDNFAKSLTDELSNARDQLALMKGEITEIDLKMRDFAGGDPMQLAALRATLEEQKRIQDEALASRDTMKSMKEAPKGPSSAIGVGTREAFERIFAQTKGGKTEDKILTENKKQTKHLAAIERNGPPRMEFKVAGATP